MTKAPPITQPTMAVLHAMQDGRWRTVDDMRLKTGIDRDRLESVLGRMTGSRWLDKRPATGPDDLVSWQITKAGIRRLRGPAEPEPDPVQAAPKTLLEKWRELAAMENARMRAVMMQPTGPVAAFKDASGLPANIRRRIERQEKVLAYLISHGEARAADVAAAMGITNNTACSDLRELTRDGRVIRVQGGNPINGGENVVWRPGRGAVLALHGKVYAKSTPDSAEQSWPSTGLPSASAGKVA